MKPCNNCDGDGRYREHNKFIKCKECKGTGCEPVLTGYYVAGTFVSTKHYEAIKAHCMKSTKNEEV